MLNRKRQSPFEFTPFGGVFALIGVLDYIIAPFDKVDYIRLCYHAIFLSL
jgi:hypothetical protein